MVPQLQESRKNALRRYTAKNTSISTLECKITVNNDHPKTTVTQLCEYHIKIHTRCFPAMRIPLKLHTNSFPAMRILRTNAYKLLPSYRNTMQKYIQGASQLCEYHVKMHACHPVLRKPRKNAGEEAPGNPIRGTPAANLNFNA